MGCAWVVSVKQLEQHIKQLSQLVLFVPQLGWDSFAFFIGKMDQEMTVFWSKTEALGQFCIFSQTTIKDNKMISH